MPTPLRQTRLTGGEPTLTSRRGPSPTPGCARCAHDAPRAPGWRQRSRTVRSTARIPARRHGLDSTQTAWHLLRSSRRASLAASSPERYGRSGTRCRSRNEA
eukprot:4007203-Prymnesium_polylepis.2